MSSDIIWMVWVLTLGIVEALIHLIRPDIFLIIEEEEWSFKIIKYKPPK